MRARRISSNTSSFTSRKKKRKKTPLWRDESSLYVAGCLLILLGKYGFISPFTSFQHHRPIAFVFWCFINDKLVITQRFWRNERISCTFINSLFFFSRKMDEAIAAMWEFRSSGHRFYSSLLEGKNEAKQKIKHNYPLLLRMQQWFSSVLSSFKRTSLVCGKERPLRNQGHVRHAATCMMHIFIFSLLLKITAHLKKIRKSVGTLGTFFICSEGGNLLPQLNQDSTSYYTVYSHYLLVREIPVLLNRI